MSLLIFDGCDLYSGTSFTKAGWSHNVCTSFASGGRFGGGHIVGNGTDPWINHPFFGAKSGMICQFAFYQENYRYNQSVITIFDATATIIGYLYMDINGSFSARNAGGITVATSATDIYQVNTWHYLELKIIPGEAGSSLFLFYLDGFNIFNLTSVDLSVGNNNVGYFRVALGTSSRFMRIDDLIFMDTDGATLNDLIGDCRIATLLPNENTVQDDWSKSVGSDAYALIDDPFGDDDSDGTYIFSNEVADKTAVGCAALGLSPSSIMAVNVVGSAKKGDSATRQVKLYIDSNGTEEAGGTKTLSTAYTVWRSFYDLDPDGDIAWSVSKVDALKIGVESIG